MTCGKWEGPYTSGEDVSGQIVLESNLELSNKVENVHPLQCSNSTSKYIHMLTYIHKEMRASIGALSVIAKRWNT